MTFRLSGIFPPQRIRSGEFRVDRTTHQRPERELFAQIYCLDPSDAVDNRLMNDYIVDRCSPALINGW